jgi:uncharacterized protein
MPHACPDALLTTPLATDLPRALGPADYRAMPWKNGGGRTLEIATQPPGTDLASFAWRISVADVERDGPFSAFAGVDRTLVLLAGRGMRLTGAGAPMDVRAPYEPVAFAGEASLQCALVDGPTRDFNLMVRRAEAQGEVRVVRAKAQAFASAQAYACFAAAGSVEVVVPGMPPVALAQDHTFLVEAPIAARGLRVRPASPGAVALVCVIEAVVAGEPA